MSRYQNPRKKPESKVKICVLDLETSARRMYLEEGGGELDETIETQQFTQAAYRSQMTAFRRLARQGIEWDGHGLPPGAWGPVVSPREARLCGVEVRKLLKQKEEWIERCRERVRKITEEQGEIDPMDEIPGADEFEIAPAVAAPAAEPPVNEADAGEYVIHAPPPEEKRSA